MPVRDFLMSSTGDWAVVNGDFAKVADRSAVLQGIQIRAQMFLADSFLDESIGIDYVNQILDVKNPDPLIVQELIREGIADTPDVTQVVATSFDGPDAERNGTVKYGIRDIYSETPVFGAVGVTLP